MNIFSKIDPEKLQQPSLRALFLIWLTFSVITTFVFYFQIRMLHHIDVPTHIGAGLVITAFIYSTVKVKNGRRALLLALIPFIVWEFIEIGISSQADPGGFAYRLFKETTGNMTQDVAMDTLGFFVFTVLTGKKF
jgi:hypothetical protein